MDNASRLGSSRLCGIGDEAGFTIEDQVAVHKALGWNHIELRSVHGVSIEHLTDAEFEMVRAAVAREEMSVPCIASGLGAQKDGLGRFVEDDIRELQVLLRRAAALRCPHIRIMSYPRARLDQDAWRREVLRRIDRLVRIARESGITLLHENCTGWGATDPWRAVEMIETCGEGLSLLFDTGNGLAFGYRPIDYLEVVLPHVSHVHVKDGRRVSGEIEWVMPGTGQTELAEIVRMLQRVGYQGRWSIEPHLYTLPHLKRFARHPEAATAFVDYGRCFERFMSRLDDEVRSEGGAVGKGHLVDHPRSS